jgi:DNA-binding protein H-NS
VEYENLSVEELQERRSQLEQEQADLERALEQRRQQAKHELAQQIRDLISEGGYDVSDIMALVPSRKRRAPAAAPKKTGRQYTQYVDPQNPENVYVRGVIPGWMKQKMQEQGYDPSLKQDREAFKANYLQAVQD